jgi:predicted kinase
MLTVDVYVGLPGCGKSTHARKQAEKDPGILIVNKDCIRNMLFGGVYAFKNSVEPVVQYIAKQSMAGALLNNYSVVVDETNITKAKRTVITNYLSIFQDEGDANSIIIRCVEFEEGPWCLERRLKDLRGLEREQWIKVYSDMKSAFEPVDWKEEGFNEYQKISTAPVGIDTHPSDTSFLFRFYNRQVQYCQSKNLPVLLIGYGWCPKCQKNVFDFASIRETADKEYITGCPHCHFSFCS